MILLTPGTPLSNAIDQPRPLRRRMVIPVPSVNRQWYRVGELPRGGTYQTLSSRANFGANL